MNSICVFCDPDVRRKEAFYEDETNIALINIKPAVEGHVLLMPKRHVEGFIELTEKEVADMFSSVRKIYSILKKAYNAVAFNLVIQDGPEAGQSINHLHLHICPRVRGDVENKKFYRLVFIEAEKREPISSEDMERTVKRLKAFVYLKT